MLEGEEQRMLNARMLEGKVIDEHTFAGVLKLDLEDKELKTGTLNLQLTSIGWDQDGTESLDISENMREYHFFSVLFSLFSGVTGLFVSYYTNVATGPTIVIFASILYFATYVYSRKHSG